MKHFRNFLTLIAFTWLFTLTAHAHQVDSISFNFKKENKHWVFTGEMDIAFMLPETRNLLGVQPLSRDAVMQAPPQEHERYRKETEKTLRSILTFTFAGKEIPWKLEFPDYDKKPFALPQGTNADWAFLTARIVIDQQSTPGELDVKLSKDETCELIIITNENNEWNLLSTLPGDHVAVLKVDATAVKAEQTDSADTADSAETSGEVISHSKFSSLLRWMKSGFEHVLPLGTDHMLFIFGLYIMVLKWRPMLWQSLLFTTSHSITLALTILGWIHLDGRLVEILIAFSIAFVGVENLFIRKVGKTRYALVFGFGLIHGMGFASVLGDKLVGVPREQLVLPLLGFNIGVEIAQIAVLILSFLLFLPVLKHEKAKRIAQIAASIAVFIAGSVWMVERILG